MVKSCSSKCSQHLDLIQAVAADVSINLTITILRADVHAKNGEYQQCGAVHEEMLEQGMAPTLASYTSLLVNVRAYLAAR